MKYSIAVPVYNSENSLEELYSRIKGVFDGRQDDDFELILVDDYSRDGSYNVMRSLYEKDKRIIAVQLAKNCGQHAALLCGFSFATGDYVVTMDDDLQHPPEEIPKLIDEILTNSSVDVVIGKYEQKKHSLIRNIGTAVSGFISFKFYHKPKNLELTSFRIMKKSVVDDLLKINLERPRIGNMILQVNSRVGNVIVEHDERKYGKSGYSFSHLVKDLVANLVTNSNFPLLVVRDVGIGTFVLSIILGVYFLLKYFLRGISITGWTSSVLLTLFYNGILLFGIGVIGDYLMRILNESRKIPNYFIRDVLKEDSNDE